MLHPPLARPSRGLAIGPLGNLSSPRPKAALTLRATTTVSKRALHCFLSFSFYSGGVHVTHTRHTATPLHSPPPHPLRSFPSRGRLNPSRHRPPRPELTPHSRPRFPSTSIAHLIFLITDITQHLDHRCFERALPRSSPSRPPREVQPSIGFLPALNCPVHTPSNLNYCIRTRVY